MKRKMNPVFNEEGRFEKRRVHFENGAKLDIKDYKKFGTGHRPYFQVRLSDSGDGWWVDQQTLDLFIAELLFLKKEWQEYLETEALLREEGGEVPGIEVDEEAMPREHQGIPLPLRRLEVPEWLQGPPPDVEEGGMLAEPEEDFGGEDELDDPDF